MARARPTRAAAACAACGIALVLLAGPAQAAWLVVVGTLVLGVVVGALLAPARLDEVDVALELPHRLRVGDPAELLISVHAGRRGSPVLRVELDAGALAPVAVLVEPLRAWASAQVRVPVLADARGAWRTQSLRLRSGAPFGLLSATHALEVPLATDVAPGLVDVPDVIARDLVTVPDESRAPRRQGAGDEVHAIREHRRGDPLRLVHWRSTARVGRLVVREVERAVPRRTAVLLAGGTPGPAYERLVALAASLAHRAWQTGEPLDLVRSGTDGVLHGAALGGLHAWSAGALAAADDLRTVVRDAIVPVAPSRAVVCLGAGVAGVAEGLQSLRSSGVDVLVVAEPGVDEGALTGVRVVGLDLGAEPVSVGVPA